ncbi:MAG: hypothetical protein CL608_14075 [Anaerolineaceae bacterium]|nr:hypothetical protein [Anaerolineaceae bacterium]
MITQRTFTEKLDTTKDILVQQNELRNQLLHFINDVAQPEEVIQITEQILPTSNQFTLTVWYKVPANKPESDINLSPEAQSADVLAQSLREKGRRDRVNTMVDEHMIRSDSS